MKKSHTRTRTKKHGSRRRTKKRFQSGKKWTTAIEAAQKTLEETRSLAKARKSLRRQALTNARKLFGSVGKL